MEDLEHTNNFVCVDGGPCRRYHPGHHVHWIHWGAAFRSPEFFKDAIVREVGEHIVEVEYLDGASETYWNHEDLPSLLAPGDPVSLHTEHHLLVVGSRALNVVRARLP